MSKHFSRALPPRAPYKSFKREKSNTVPPPIKHIYQSVLVDGRMLVCEKIDWMFPVGYKISIFDKGLESIICGKPITMINGRISDYAIASYILQPGRIIVCPIQNDKIE